MKFFLLIPSILLCQLLTAQEIINTDRPDQSDGAYILPKQKFQIETGVLLTREDQDNSSYIHSTMLRYGLINKIELRLGIEEGVEKNRLSGKSQSGLYPTAISTKINLIKAKSWYPDITAVGYLELPFTAGKKFRPHYFSKTFLLAFQNDFTDKIDLGYNIGIKSDEFETTWWLATASLGIELTKKSSAFGEYFAEYAKQVPPLHNIDFGVLYLLKNNFQIDIALGSGLFNNSDTRYLTTGISYKFN